MSNFDHNVDPAEIAKFEALASRWWDPDGEFKPLHQMNPLRIEFIKSRIVFEQIQALDVGCGGGLLTEGLFCEDSEITGIDMGEAPLSVAKLHAMDTGKNIRYLKFTAEELAAIEPAQYHLVTCLEMLEHVPEPQSVVNACATLAKPGAQLFFSTINRHPKAFAFAILGAEYALNILPKGTHEYKKFIRPSELSACIRNAGLVIKETVGVLYSPFKGTFRISPHDLDVNYMMHVEKPL